MQGTEWCDLTLTDQASCYVVCLAYMDWPQLEISAGLTETLTDHAYVVHALSRHPLSQGPCQSKV